MVSIRKRGESFYAYWREGHKIRQVVLGRDLRFAKMKRIEIEKRLLNKQNGLPVEITWDEFKKKYSIFSSANHTEQTAIRNEVVFRNVEKTLQIQKISELSAELLEQYKATRKNDGIQASTLNRELITIKSAMKKAADWGYATSDIKTVQKARVVKKRPTFFTKDDLRVLLSKADDLWKTIILLGFYAGLRRGEILHLEWVDVDFQQHLLRITPRDDWHPKNKSAREIPMHPQLEEKLSEWRQQRPDFTKVVPWDKKHSLVSLYFGRLRKLAGIAKGSIHSLRHSFASHLATNGVSLSFIQELMGHSSVTTTQIYAHLSPSSLKEAISKIPSIAC